MKKISSTFLLGIFLCAFSITSFAQQDQRIHTAYMLTFGRDASQAEVSYWLTRGNLSIAQLIGFHQQYLKQDDNTHRSTIDRAYQDAMGRHSTEAEINYWKSGNDTYTTLLKNHVSWLQGNPAEYDKVIRRSYQYVFNRQPNAGELSYWKSQGTVSYLMLVGFHQDFQRRNLQESGNTVNLRNASSVVSISLSPAVAAEAKIISGNGSAIVVPGTGKLITNDGGSIVAAGAGNIVTNTSAN